MNKQKGKSDPVLKIVSTMKLARALNCSYEEAAQRMKAMCKLNVIQRKKVTR